MSKRSIVILVVIALALTMFSLALSRRDSRDWRANRSRRLFPFPWQDTSAISIDRNDGEPLFFSKDETGEWMIHLVDDLKDTVANQAVDEISALATLAWREPFREQIPPSIDVTATLTATSASGQQVQLAFGHIASNVRAVMIDGEKEVVYGVNQDLLKFLEWPAERFRKMTLANAATGVKPARITLSPPGGNPDLRITLEAGEDGWNMSEPVAWPVDETRLDLLLRWVERLRADSIEAEFASDLDWFGFNPESAYIEAVYPPVSGGTQPTRRRVEFGGDAGDGKVYVRTRERTPVFAISQQALAEISFEAAESYPDLWRNFYRKRGLSALGEGLPVEISIERLLPTPQKLTISQVRGKDGLQWRGVLEKDGGQQTFSIDPPDNNEAFKPLTALITGLSSLRVKNFLADIPPGPDTVKWTAFPAWRFSAKGSDGKNLPALLVYAANAEGHLPAGDPYVKGRAEPNELVSIPGFPDRTGIAFSLDGTPAVLEMHAELSYLLCLPLYRYHSTRLLDRDPRLWSRLEIETDGNRAVYYRHPGEINEQWWREGPADEPLMDDNNLLVSLLLELSQLRSDGFVAYDDAMDAEFGLDQPSITAIVYDTKMGGENENPEETGLTLEMGAPVEGMGSQRYARLNGQGPVFILSARLADALARDYK